MITPKTVSRKQAQRILQLLEQIHRCEIMARFGPFHNLEFAQYVYKKTELEDELRTLLYDESNLFQLGVAWGLVSDPTKRKRRTLKKSKPKTRPKRQ